MQEDDSVKMQALDDFNQAAEDKSQEIYDIISNQGLFKWPANSNKLDDLYHFNDFVQDSIDDFDNLVYDVFKGNHESVQYEINEKLCKWCDDLATKVIKGEA